VPTGHLRRMLLARVGADLTDVDLHGVAGRPALLVVARDVDDHRLTDGVAAMALHDELDVAADAGGRLRVEVAQP